MKKILIINGHPVENSYGEALSKAYYQGATKANLTVTEISVRELDFNPNLMYGYKKRMEIEPDIENAIQLLKEADHIVWIFPLWWHGLPALLKGFIDRTFLPDVAYKRGKGKLPTKLFKGKSSRIIMTCDTPKWYNFLFLKNPAVNELKKGILGYCGVKPVKVSYISPIRNSSESNREDWINKIHLIGTYGK